MDGISQEDEVESNRSISFALPSSTNPLLSPVIVNCTLVVNPSSSRPNEVYINN